MDYTINTSTNGQTTIEVKIPADEIDAFLDKALLNVQKKATLQGFRKGKVPTEMVKRLFASQIKNEAQDLGIEDAWRRIFSENQFDLYNEPLIVGRHVDDQGNVTFSIVFEQYPQVNVPDLRGMQIEKIVWQVTPEAVDQVLENLRQDHAMLYLKEDAAQPGDYVLADFQEIDASGVPLLGSSFNDQMIYLAPNDNELAPQLVGVKAGDQRRVMLKRQKSEMIEQPNREQDTVFYQAVVKEVKERRLPELDDEFVKDLGGRYKTLAELRESIEADLRRRAERETETGFENALITEVVKRSDLELPPSMIEKYTDRLVERALKRNEQLDEEALRNYFRPQAVFDLKWMLISEEIKKQQGFTVDEQDIEAKLEPYRQSENGQRLIESLRKDEKEMERLKEDILSDKLIAWLASQAEIRETVRPFSELLRSPEN
ncbi:MAG: trigger factor [candidate division KSB1 bacterium]|nr:trigger factor [candidate division KSB1 bacterium]MDZ7345547.1 trigger factor [candidate division KSB1 bacterium]